MGYLDPNINLVMLSLDDEYFLEQLAKNNIWLPSPNTLSMTRIEPDCVVDVIEYLETELNLSVHYFNEAKGIVVAVERCEDNLLVGFVHNWTYN